MGLSTVKLLTAQLSFDPLLRREVVRIKLPKLSSATVEFLQIALGRIVSLIVITELQEPVFPVRSVTTKVTFAFPIFPQLKVELFRETVDIPQLSVDPLLTWVVEIAAVPVVLKKTVTFLQNAVGGSVSRTVTIEAQLEEFP